MSKVWNINVLLCEKANDDVSTIENIFDKLVINKKNRRGNFTIVIDFQKILCLTDKF